MVRRIRERLTRSLRASSETVSLNFARHWTALWIRITPSRFNEKLRIGMVTLMDFTVDAKIQHETKKRTKLCKCTAHITSLQELKPFCVVKGSRVRALYNILRRDFGNRHKKLRYRQPESWRQKGLVNSGPEILTENML